MVEISTERTAVSRLLNSGRPVRRIRLRYRLYKVRAILKETTVTVNTLVRNCRTRYAYDYYYPSTAKTDGTIDCLPSVYSDGVPAY